MASTDRTRAGFLFGILAYTCWGIVPIYFQQLRGISPFEVLSHRVLWSMVLLWGVIVATRGLGRAREVLRSRRTMTLLAASTVLIAINWLCYIHAVQSGRVMQGSLGYYINPLVNVLLGVVFLGERLRPPQLVTIVLATAGVLVMAIAGGEFPWLSLVLGFSFGTYALLRKVANADGLTGLAIETSLLAPLAAAYMAVSAANHTLAFRHTGTRMDLLLASAGVITSVPLIWFIAAAKRLTMTTLGILQYISPTMQFAVAVWSGEQVTVPKAICFVLIWAGLAIFTWDALRSRARSAAAPANSGDDTGVRFPDALPPTGSESRRDTLRA